MVLSDNMVLSQTNGSFSNKMVLSQTNGSFSKQMLLIQTDGSFQTKNGSFTNNDHSKSKFYLKNVPNGWLLSVDSFGRKYYYNEIEKDKNLVN